MFLTALKLRLVNLLLLLLQFFSVPAVIRGERLIVESMLLGA